MGAVVLEFCPADREIDPQFPRHLCDHRRLGPLIGKEQLDIDALCRKLLAPLPQEIPDLFDMRPDKELFGPSFRKDSSVTQESDPLADLPDDFHLVRDHYDRDPHLLVDALQKRKDPLCNLGIQRTGRFVAEEELRIQDKRPRDRNALFLSAGKLTWPGMHFIAKTDKVDQAMYFLFRLRRIRLHSPELHRESNIVIDIQALKQVEPLEDHAHPALQFAKRDLVGRRYDRLVHSDLTAVIWLEPVDTSQERRFSRAALPDDPVDLAVVDLKGDSFEDFQFLKRFCDILYFDHKSIPV